MKIELKQCLLNDVADITKLAGFEFTKYMKYIDDGEIIAIRALNLKNGKLVLDDVKRISKDVSCKLERSQLKKYDIVISYTGTIGECAQITENGKYHLAPNVAKITPKENIDPGYLFQYIRSSIFKNLMKSYCHGSTQPTIPMKVIREIPINILSINSQQKIASILSALDNKIELNQKINENLQRQATALFSSLYNQTNEEVGLTEIIQILSGGTPKTGENSYWNGDIPFFTPKDIGLPYTLSTEKNITKDGLAHCNSRLYPVNTVFITARGTVGKVGLSGIPMAMNQSCYALAGKNTHQLLVYFYAMKAVDRLKHKASGAVFDAITIKDFETESIFKLSDTESKAFLCIAEPFYQTILNNTIENQRLTDLRDSLLPRLISGELDVSNLDL